MSNRDQGVDAKSMLAAFDAASDTESRLAAIGSVNLDVLHGIVDGASLPHGQYRVPDPSGPEGANAIWIERLPDDCSVIGVPELITLNYDSLGTFSPERSPLNTEDAEDVQFAFDMVRYAVARVAYLEH